MSFFANLLAHTAAHMYSDIQKEKKEEEKHRNIYNQLQIQENSLNQYLKSVGTICEFYIFDVGCIEGGWVTSEINKMNEIRNLVAEYISLGGDAIYIEDVNEPDFSYRIKLQIKLLKLLNSKAVEDKDELFFYEFQCTDEMVNLIDTYISLGGELELIGYPMKIIDKESFHLTPNKVKENIKKLRVLKENNVTDEEEHYYYMMEKTFWEIKEEFE